VLSLPATASNAITMQLLYYIAVTQFSEQHLTAKFISITFGD